MGEIDWRRVLVCGSAAGLAWSLLSVPLLVLFGGETIDAVPRPLVTVARIGSFTLNVVAGIWAVWLYAALGPRYGAGLKTAAIAGFSWWLIATIATWQWVDLGFIRFRGLVGLIGATLPALIGVTMFGAWSYQARPKAFATTARPGSIAAGEGQCAGAKKTALYSTASAVSETSSTEGSP